jgi:ribosomal protein S18 acetylase RimI-like enzyme
MHCRPAQPTDAEVIVEFNVRLAAESEGKRLDRETLRRGVAAVLADRAKGRYFVAVAESKGEVIGQVMLTYEWSDWRDGFIWWIQSVYVAEPHRRRGVFRALFEHVRREAEADPGVVGLRLYVEEHNTRAHATYGNLGMNRPGYFVMETMFADLRRDAVPAGEP